MRGLIMYPKPLNQIIDDYELREDNNIKDLSKYKKQIFKIIDQLKDVAEDIEDDLLKVGPEYYYYDRIKFLKTYVKEKGNPIKVLDIETLRTLILQSVLFGQHIFEDDKGNVIKRKDH